MLAHYTPGYIVFCRWFPFPSRGSAIPSHVDGHQPNKIYGNFVSAKGESNWHSNLSSLFSNPTTVSVELQKFGFNFLILYTFEKLPKLG